MQCKPVASLRLKRWHGYFVQYLYLYLFLGPLYADWGIVFVSCRQPSVRRQADAVAQFTDR